MYGGSLVVADIFVCGFFLHPPMLLHYLLELAFFKKYVFSQKCAVATLWGFCWYDRDTMEKRIYPPPEEPPHEWFPSTDGNSSQFLFFPLEGPKNPWKFKKRYKQFSTQQKAKNVFTFGRCNILNRFRRHLKMRKKNVVFSPQEIPPAFPERGKISRKTYFFK